jgi:hypothetical protein
MHHFHKGIQDLKRYSKKESLKQAKTLSHIFSLLGGDIQGNAPSTAEHSVQPDTANHPDQMSLASDSTGTTGSIPHKTSLGMPEPFGSY